MVSPVRNSLQPGDSNFSFSPSTSRYNFTACSMLATNLITYLSCVPLYRLFKEVDKGLAVLMVILGSLMVAPIFIYERVNGRCCPSLRVGSRILVHLR